MKNLLTTIGNCLYVDAPICRLIEYDAIYVISFVLAFVFICLPMIILVYRLFSMRYNIKNGIIKKKSSTKIIEQNFMKENMSKGYVCSNKLRKIF